MLRLHALNLPCPTTGTAGDGSRPGLRAVAQTAIARGQPVDLELPPNAEGRLTGTTAIRELPGLRPGAGRLTPATSRRRPLPNPPPKNMSKMSCISGHALPAGTGSAEGVVALALLRVGQDLVCPGDLFEPGFAGGFGVHVGVELASQLSIGLLRDRRPRRRALHPGSRTGPSPEPSATSPAPSPPLKAAWPPRRPKP